MSNDSKQKTFVVATLLCLVCSILVSGAAVNLRPAQALNAALDKKRNILESAGLYKPGDDIDELFKDIEPRVVDLATGLFKDDLDPESFNAREAARDPEQSVEILDGALTGIKRRAKYKVVYLLKGDSGEIEQIITPVHGKGLWSTMYGFIAIANDFTTIKGFAFYEHGETPGLGGEVDNPKWKAQWPGKKIFDESWQRRAEVLKGRVDTKKPEAIYQADGLSGATITTRGISDLLSYWFSDEGYGKLLTNLRTGAI